MKHIIKLTLLCIYLMPTISFAGELIEYDKTNDVLTLRLNDVYLDDALQQLAEQIRFKLVLDGEDIHRKVTLSIKGNSKKVIQQLVQPNSVILSQSAVAPYQVTNVILLPVGEHSIETRIRQDMPMPVITDNAEDNARRMADYERRVQRWTDGKGRRNNYHE